MSTNGANATDDVDMAECDGEKVVTMMDVLQEQQDFEDDANAVLGASDEKNCTYSTGYIKRQAIYACLTCCPDAKDDPNQRAGVCLACSINCHENHDLVELYTKRNFRCDCGNPKFKSNPCQFTPNKTELNEDNIYNQNFSGLYCICHRPYPDPEAEFEDEMIQCVICEDWLHSAHLEAVVPNSDQYSEMICKACMEKNEFLHDYSDLAVNVDNSNVDILSIDASSVVISSITSNGDINGLFDNDTKFTDKEGDDVDESVKNSTEPSSEVTGHSNDSDENNEVSSNKHTEDEFKANSVDNATDETITEAKIDDTNISIEETPKTDLNLEPIDTENTTNQIIDNITNNLAEVSESSKDSTVDKMDTELENKDSIEDTLEAATKELSELTKDNDSELKLDTETENIQDEKDNMPDNDDSGEADSKVIDSISENTHSESDDNDIINPKVDADEGDKESKLTNDDTEDNLQRTLPNADGDNCESESNNADSSDNIHRAEPNLDDNEETESKLVNDDSSDNHTTEPNIDAIDDTESKLTDDDNSDKNYKTVHDINNSGDEESKLLDDKMDKTEPEMDAVSDDIPRAEVSDQAENITEKNDTETLIQIDSDKVQPTESTEPMNQESMNNDNIDSDIPNEVLPQINDDADDESKFSTIDVPLNSNDLTEISDQSVSAMNGTDEDSKLSQNETNLDRIQSDVNINGECSSENNEGNTEEIKTNSENKRKYNQCSEDLPAKKQKIASNCKRPKGTKKIYNGATFWPSNFRQKLCMCNECLSMYKDLNVLFLTDREDTVVFYEALGQERNNGGSSQYEKGLEALSSLDRIQQINAMTEYNKLRDKLLDYFKSFKDRKEVVKEEDIKAFFAGMKPRREPDGVYFCR